MTAAADGWTDVVTSLPSSTCLSAVATALETRGDTGPNDPVRAALVPFLTTWYRPRPTWTHDETVRALRYAARTAAVAASNVAIPTDQDTAVWTALAATDLDVRPSLPGAPPPSPREISKALAQRTREQTDMAVVQALGRCAMMHDESVDDDDTSSVHAVVDDTEFQPPPRKRQRRQ